MLRLGLGDFKGQLSLGFGPLDANPGRFQGFVAQGKVSAVTATAAEDCMDVTAAVMMVIGDEVLGEEGEKPVRSTIEGTGGRDISWRGEDTVFGTTETDLRVHCWSGFFQRRHPFLAL